MDGLINKLPLQGVVEIVAYSYPRRCHWTELINGFQPLHVLRSFNKNILTP
jgi:hypothetical protein